MSSRWWKRGWTLQELIAPSNVWFFDADHEKIGARNNAEIASRISSMTTIDYGLLTHVDNVHLRDFSIAFRMSWASTRSTTRIEDEAYSLIGIFDVNMPHLYGEGRKAFRRLQKQIMQQTYDATILAFTNEQDSDAPFTLLASSTRQFQKSGRLSQIPSSSTSGLRYTLIPDGLHVNQAVFYCFNHPTAMGTERHFCFLLGFASSSNTDFAFICFIKIGRRTFLRAAKSCPEVIFHNPFRGERQYKMLTDVTLVQQAGIRAYRPLCSI